MKQRVEVKFECEAERVPSNPDVWGCTLPDGKYIRVPSEYVKPIMAVEPTESAFYRLTYASGHKGVAHRTSNFWTSENTETLEQLERDAYNSGDTVRAALIQAIIDLRQQVGKLEDVETLEHWERNNGPAIAYKEFFYDCFEHLSRHYPAPDVRSDYDKGVIFEAIARGEGVTE